MTKPLDIIRPEDLATLEQSTITQAYRKFRKIKIKWNIPFERKYLTFNELVRHLGFSHHEDIEDLKLKLSTR